MKAIAFGQDGSFSWEDLAARYQAELANGFGNLASRVLAMVGRYFEGAIPAPAEYTDADKAIIVVARKATQDADEAIERVAIQDAITSIWTLVDELNNYITVQQPWVLAKTEETRERLGTVLYVCSEGLRALSVLLAPVIPKATGKLWAAVTGGSLGALDEATIASAAEWGVLPVGTQIADLEPLFPRIETEVEGK
jgi:methionyl-tRNA synthetase